MALALSRCGSSSPPQTTTPPGTGTTTPSVTVSVVASSSGGVIAGQTVDLTATTTDPKGVKWSLSGQGSLSGATSTSVTYHAPSSVSTGFVATVTATSVSDPKISKSVTVDVLGGPGGVGGTPVTILNDSLPNGVASVSYVEPAFVSGGVPPYNYSLSTGSLPPGLRILGNNNGTPYPSGTIYGIPTTAGTSSFTFTVTDSASPPDVAMQNLTLTINPAGTLTIFTPALNNGMLGVFYGDLPAILGGTGNYTVNITAGTLPPGLSISTGSVNPVGEIYGTPKTAGTYNFTYQALDSSYPPNVANANFSITIYPAGTFAVLTPSLPNGTVGVSYGTQQPLVSGGIQPYTFSISAGALPPGLSLNTSTGTISGAPTTAGTYNFTYAVTDFAIPPQTVTASFSTTVAPVPPPLTITTTGSPEATVGTLYTAAVQVTGGTPPYTWTNASSPSQNGTNATIAFLPTSTGVENFTASVMDSLGDGASTTLNVTVGPANCPDDAHFQGNYAMLFNGPSEVGDNFTAPTLFVGSFVADGAGNISQGYLDNGDYVTSTGLTGTYCIDPTNQGILTYQNTIYLMNLGSSGNADFIVYQNPGEILPQPAFGFGTLAKQDTTAFSASDFVGQYSFGLSGDTSSFGEIQAGTFSNDGAGNLTNGELDYQGPGNPYNVTFTAKDFAVAPFGRGTVTLTESSGAPATEIFYVVNSSELFAVAAPAYIAGPIVQSTGGPYTNGSLNGISVFGLQGSALVSGAPLKSQIGLITWDGAANFTLTPDQNQDGTLTTVSYSGTYSVESDGRVTLTSSTESLPPVFYLSGPNQGSIIGQQAAGPFEGSSFSGSFLGRMLNTYATRSNCCLPTLETELDNFSADGVSSLTGTSYLDDQWNGPSVVVVSSTYTVASSGRGVVSANGAQTDIFYIVSPTQVLMMPSATQYPKVMSVAQP